MERDIEDIECTAGEMVDTRDMKVRIVGSDGVVRVGSRRIVHRLLSWMMWLFLLKRSFQSNMLCGSTHLAVHTILQMEST